MEFNTDYEKTFFNLSLLKPKYLTLVKRGYYKTKEIDVLSRIAAAFYTKFKETPSAQQIIKLIEYSKEARQLEINEDYVYKLYSENLKEYEQEWLETTAEAWIKWKTFDNSLLDIMEYVNTNKVTPSNVDTIITKVKTLVNDKNNINFNNNIGLNFFDAAAHNQREEDKINSGYNIIDRITNGGYDKKSLVVYAGEQNIGKSIFLANDAVSFVKRGKNVAVISAEMSDYKFVKRLGANALNIPISEYNEKSKDKSFIKRKLDNLGLGIMPPGELFINSVPTSQYTVLDIEQYLLDLEEREGFKLDVIIIDYINILSNYRNPNSDNTYMKIKQIAEDLRALAVKYDWLIISATQIRRDGYDSTNLTMEHIAESAGLSHTADMIYGIIQDTIMHDANEYVLKILKIRDGEGKNLRFRLNIDYEYMRLSELEELKTNENDTE